MVLSREGSASHEVSQNVVAVPLDLSIRTQQTLSFEFFPPKTDAGLENLFRRLESMSDMKPKWIDVTFGAGGGTRDRTLEICDFALNKLGLNVMMHLTCTNMTQDDLDIILKRMRDIGIRNILALRGDPPAHESCWTPSADGFKHAVDLVRYIRQKYGDYFCIAVAGYPEGHADCESLEIDIHHLKDKVLAGASLVVTQLFYDVGAYFRFVTRLKELGVSVPVIPGIMPILSTSSLKRMTTLCKVSVPESVLRDLESFGDDEKRTREYGVDLAVQMCRELLSHKAPGIHIYTMNNEENIRTIVEGLDSMFSSMHSQRLTQENESLLTP
jgi:methylenetetrahydrofolate reductase (NADPH)